MCMYMVEEWLCGGEGRRGEMVLGGRGGSSTTPSFPPLI
jgi:hypothetical protein